MSLYALQTSLETKRQGGQNALLFFFLLLICMLVYLCHLRTLFSSSAAGWDLCCRINKAIKMFSSWFIEKDSQNLKLPWNQKWLFFHASMHESLGVMGIYLKQIVFYGFSHHFLENLHLSNLRPIECALRCTHSTSGNKLIIALNSISTSS